MNQTKTFHGQDHDEFIYMMDSCRESINASRSAQDSWDRPYEDILLQTVSLKYDSIRRAHREVRGFKLAKIRRMMATVYADNFSRQRIASAGIAGPGAVL